jgi:TRAP-type C4-dicarboxylate transport system permease small subunit
MRDFFIRSMELILNVVVVLSFLALIVVSGIVAFGGGGMMPPGVDAPGMAGGAGGPVAGLLLLVIGAIYLTLVFGFMYLGLGIYQNTLRTANALERRA